ncbi:MAG: TRAP transporter small permease [Synergistaceae bacterium]|jgi:TRAP-type C4-dicarboxylate transport system permease small subunit|nr:TRAP transporter small permease [Synergistaceae bacterium]
MNALKKAALYYDKIEERILVASFVVTVSIVSLQVIMRYVFNNSLSWSEELTRFVFVWQVWMGTSIACKNNNHIRVEILLSLLKGRAKTAYLLLGDIIVLVFTVFLIYDGFIVVGRFAARHMLSPAMRIPLFIVYLSLPVSSVCVCARLLPRVAGEIGALFGGQPAEPAKEG